MNCEFSSVYWEAQLISENWPTQFQSFHIMLLCETFWTEQTSTVYVFWSPYVFSQTFGSVATHEMDEGERIRSVCRIPSINDRDLSYKQPSHMLTHHISQLSICPIIRESKTVDIRTLAIRRHQMFQPQYVTVPQMSPSGRDPLTMVPDYEWAAICRTSMFFHVHNYFVLECIH